MASPSGITFPLLFTWLTLFIFPLLSASIPHRSERQTTGSAFEDLLLVRISKVRADAGVPLLQWNPATAFTALINAQACSRSPQAGEIISKGLSVPPDWIPTWDATNESIDNWNAEPHTTDLATSPGYAVITKQSHTSFGCGWNQDVCPGNMYYLHCFFGTWEVPASSVSLLPEKRAAIRPGTELANLIATTLNHMRGRFGVGPMLSWSDPWAQIAGDRAQNCFKDPQIQEMIGFPIFSTGPFTPGADETKATLDRWNEESHTFDLAKARNFGKVADPKYLAVGCGWNKDDPARSLIARNDQAAPTDMNPYKGLLLSGINGLRYDAKQPDLKWSDAISSWGIKQGVDKCNSFDISRLSIHVVTANVYWTTNLSPNPDFGEMSLQAGRIWNDTKPVNAQWNSNGPVPEYVKIVQSQWSQVGCTWSPNCTAKDNYVLSCYFAEEGFVPPSKRIDVAIRQDDSTKLDNDIGQAFTLLRQLGGIKNPSIQPDHTLDQKSQSAADQCDGVKGHEFGPNGYGQNTFLWDDASGQLSVHQMTDQAITQWASQKHSSDQDTANEAAVIADSKMKSFGCAWSTKCGSKHWLFCTFSTTSPHNQQLDNVNPRAEGTLEAQQTDIQNLLGQAFVQIRKDLKNPNPAMHYSGALTTQSESDANSCNGQKSQTLYDQIIFKWDDADGKLSTEDMTLKAIVSWVEEQYTSNPNDYYVIADKEHQVYGCGWSDMCGGVHWLYCSFFHL